MQPIERETDRWRKTAGERQSEKIQRETFSWETLVFPFLCRMIRALLLTEMSSSSERLKSEISCVTFTARGKLTQNLFHCKCCSMRCFSSKKTRWNLSANAQSSAFCHPRVTCQSRSCYGNTICCSFLRSQKLWGEWLAFLFFLLCLYSNRALCCVNGRRLLSCKKAAAALIYCLTMSIGWGSCCWSAAALIYCLTMSIGWGSCCWSAWCRSEGPLCRESWPIRDFLL